MAITSLVLAFAFAFDDKRPVFELAYWVANFLKVFLIVAVSVLLHDFAHDLVAKKHGFFAEYAIWGVKKFSFRKEPAFPKTISIFGKQIKIEALPIGIILSIFVTLLSNGKLFFAAVSTYLLVIKRVTRFGRSYIHVTDYEEAKIALAGPLTNAAIAIVLGIFNFSGIFSQAILINSVMAAFDILPLPGLDGFKVLIGSTGLYVFSFIFIIAIAILLNFFSFIPALLLSIALALVFGIVYLYLKLYR